MIYDVFHFNDELDLLEIRLDLHDSFVDRYILIESTRTYSGMPKPLNFQENKARYSKYLHKIDHIILDFPFETNENWAYEHKQRNIIKGFNFSSNDYVIYTDCDEILRLEAINTTLRFESKYGEERLVPVYHLDMDLCFYYLNLRVKSQSKVNEGYHLNSCFKNRWHMGKIIRGDCINNFRNAYEIRQYQINSPQKEATILNAGWHFSNLGDAERIFNKLGAISHSNEPLFKKLTKEDVKINKELLLDPLGRDGVEYETFELPEYFNKWVKLCKA